MVIRQKGQGLTEYLIIVALIAVSAIGVYSFFGKTIRNQVSALSSEVSGKNSSANIGSAQTASQAATDNANQDYDLGNFNDGAAQGEGGSDGGSGDGSGTVD
ncbi:pilus assembly protein [Pseudoalteromonas sp. 2CM41L]|uniref:Flp family type IVb pilin n=1 Tax=unclassified Pseudoalteromonas TaxID=194690 RepID=UPI0020BF4D93|nr:MULTISPECIES: pilus assembly protein [unclassified Pseudoalteromonas]MCK8106528.1 pilus assembly protein [Pseudoalteromonas sp. 2CM41L]MCK8136607.1 pilus assembly protein [Pseudoalteromonas sp. 2CM28B]